MWYTKSVYSERCTSRLVNFAFRYTFLVHALRHKTSHLLMSLSFPSSLSQWLPCSPSFPRFELGFFPKSPIADRLMRSMHDAVAASSCPPGSSELSLVSFRTAAFNMVLSSFPITWMACRYLRTVEDSLQHRAVYKFPSRYTCK